MYGLSLVFPIVGTYFYLSISKEKIQQVVSTWNPTTLSRIVILHNLAIQVFSAVTFYRLSSVLITHGLISSPGYFFNVPGVRSTLFWFYLSKYYEYIDTIILYAKHKEPIFLQKFHHAGATIVWHLGYVYEFDGLFYASLLNSGVHSIMYLYFLVSLYPEMRKRISKYKIYITTLQVGQLAFGAWALPRFYYAIETRENQHVIWAFDIYIGILLALFGHFMVVNYVDRKKVV